MNRSPKLLRALLSCVMIAGAAIACGDDDDPNDPGDGGGGGGDGTFSASASGAISGSRSGDAFFGTAVEADAESGDAFVIVLGDLTGIPTSVRGPELFSVQESFSMILASDAGSLDEGTYDVVSQPTEGPILRAGEFIVVMTFTDEATTPGGSGSAIGVSGSVELESVSSGNVEGNFTIQFQVFFGDGTQGTSTVSGSFDAIDGTVPIDL